MSNRLVSVALAAVLVATGCSGDDDDTRAASTSSTTLPPRTNPTTTTTPERGAEIATSDECPGIGAAPADATITWVADERLWESAVDGSGRHCLLEIGTYPEQIEWGGAADRLLIGDHTIVTVDGVVAIGGEDDRLLSWSRPTGKAIVARRDDDTFVKYPLGEAPPVDLAGLPPSTIEARYHPSGTAIVAIEKYEENPPTMVMTNNLGENGRWIVTNETADDLSGLDFTADGSLLFSARHRDRHELHRYDFAANELTTVLEDEQPLGAMASPFRRDDLAVARLAHGPEADGELWVVRDSEPVNVAGTPIASGRPVGWFPDGSLLVADEIGCCDLSPFDLYLLDAVPRLAVRDVWSAAVRAVLPPPPPPPPDIDEAAPA